ncbi:MAG: nitrogenase component 1 [Bacillota bacterium]|jgi:nitrogenase molybdenum-cofactor synthesis protein NifE
MTDQLFVNLSLAQARHPESILRNKRLTARCLQYTPPSHGGWGIVRVGMLVPEAVMLFIAPPACGRHGAIAGLQLGFKERLFYLYLSETDLISGAHLETARQAAREILTTIKPHPKALLFCVSCVDYLLGSDFESIVVALEVELGIPVRLSYMNPIAMDGKTPPQLNMQRTIYSFLPERTATYQGAQKRSVNLVGNFTPVDRHSEIYEVLQQAGCGEVLQLSACNSFTDLEALSGSSHNLLIRPEGRLAAEMMEQKLGIPFCYVPVAYGLETIAGHYRTLEAFFGVALDTRKYQAEAQKAIDLLLRRLGPLRLAVSSGINAMPFELSRALTEFGLKVAYIFCDEIMAADAEHLDWLVENSPETRVLTQTDPGMPDFRISGYPVDLAVGYTAAYYCQASRTVPLSMDRQWYGYRGTVSLLRALVEAWENPRDLRQMIAEATMVI